MGKRLPIADNFKYSQINAGGYPLNGRECWRHQLPRQLNEPVYLSSDFQQYAAHNYSKVATQSVHILKCLGGGYPTIREFTL
jgi:hypothetical protein